jgi:F0F1-type ATP synthase assembly protein I
MSEDKWNPNSILQFTSITFQWFLLLGLGVWGGLQLDEHWHCKPIFIILLPLLALSYCFYALIKSLQNKK